MHPTSDRRRRYFVDSPVQSAIMWQGLSYWFIGAIIYTLVVTTVRIIPACFAEKTLSVEVVTYHLTPMVVASAIILPVVLLMSLRFSHRLVGPMVRFRKALAELASGETPSPITLRGGDFWGDVAEQLNTISARLADGSEGEEPEQPSIHEYQDSLAGN